MAETTAIHILSLADRGITRLMGRRDIDAIATRLGAPVVFEHQCLPPIPLLISDLKFLENNPGLAGAETLRPIMRAANAIRSCSFMIMDDVAEFGISRKQVFGVLSHALERDRRTDLIAVREQKYAHDNHRLPLTLVSGADLPMGNRTDLIAALQHLTGKPIFKIATASVFATFTQGWDFERKTTVMGTAGGRQVVEAADLAGCIAEWALKNKDALARSTLEGPSRMIVDDLGHYCSHYLREADIRRVLDVYGSYCVVGQRSSVPFIDTYLDMHNKTCIRSESYSAADLDDIDEPFDIVLACGPRGRPTANRPMIALMHGGWATHNFDHSSLKLGRFKCSGREVPDSNADWHHDFKLTRQDSESVGRALEGVDMEAAEDLAAARVARHQAVKRDREAAQLERRRERDERLAAARGAKEAAPAAGAKGAAPAAVAKRAAPAAPAADH